MKKPLKGWDAAWVCTLSDWLLGSLLQNTGRLGNAALRMSFMRLIILFL